MKSARLSPVVLFFGLLFAAGFTPAAFAEDARPSLKEISKKMDDLYRSSSSRAVMRMKVVTPNYSRDLEMESWSRGQDDSLIRINTPRKEKGTATLKKGNEMWNYLPKIKKTMRIPPSLMMNSWMGSDFSNDDLVSASSWERDYSAEFTQAPKGELCVEYKAKENAPVAWERVIACMSAESYLPRRFEYYDEKGRKMRMMEYSDVKEFDGRKIPSVMTLTPLSEEKKGNKTVITYVEMDFDAEVPDTMFSLTRLRRSR